MQSRLSHISSSVLTIAAATILVAGGGTFASIAAGTVPAAVAQDQAGAPPSGAAASPQRGRMRKALMSLDLTDAQKTQIRALVADARKQNENVTDPDTKRANMREAYKKIDTILTPAQRTELHAKLDAMRSHDADPHAR